MVECNICGWSGQTFQPLWEHRSVICPGCGSYERHRAIAYYLEQTEVFPTSSRVLETGSGETSALKLFLERQGCKYFSLDVRRGYGSVCGDVSSLPFQTAAFDVVVSIHVLEHLADDFKALSEMFRALKADGLMMIQVPYEDDRFDTVEHTAEPFATARAEYHFHHRRDYGLDIIERLGFFRKHVVEVHPLLLCSKDEARRHGFEKNFGTTFFCSDSPAVNDYPGQLCRNIMELKRRWLTERRAYEIYLARNGDGSRLSDWLQAEAEVERLTDDELAALNIFGRLAPQEGGREKCEKD